MAASSPYQSASLYVGDLNPTVTEALLFEIFKAVGPVASIRVCRDAVTRRSLGYAYVNFHNVVDAERALDTLNYALIKGRPCRIMWSHRDPSMRKSGQGNIFIKNLDKTIDNKALYDTFSAFGNILSCKVVTDGKGNSKGYGFVHYETREAADGAISKVNGMLLNGKIVYVGPFIARKERIPGSDPEQFTNIYIKNLDALYTDEDLKRDFGAMGTIQSAVLMRDPRDDGRQFAFVNFENHEDARRAVDELNTRKLVGDREVYVGRAQKKTEREALLRKLREERAQKYQGINLYIKNLDDSVNSEELEKIFGAFGSITSCKVMSDDKTASRGFGFVCFTSADDASKAVAEMNGKMVVNKPIYVALAERKDVRRAKLEAQHAARAAARLAGNPNLAGAPMGYPGFYAPQAPQAQRQGFVGYPPQGVPVARRPWTGAPGAAAPHAQGRQYQPIPGYVMPVAGGGGGGARQAHRQPRPAGQAAAAAGGGLPGAVQGAPGVAPAQQNGRAAAGGFKYTQNARNQQTAQSQSQQVPSKADIAGLTSPSLASASPEERKNILGESLYPLVEALTSPKQGPKITGMLLESMNVSELLHLLQSPEALREKVDEAVEVLKAHGGDVANGAELGNESA